MNSALQGVELPLAYSLIRVTDLCYEQWVTLGQHNSYICTITQSDSQVYKLVIFIFTVQCHTLFVLFPNGVLLGSIFRDILWIKKW